MKAESQEENFQRQRETVDDERNVNIIKNKEVSDSDRHATNYDDE